MSFIDRLRDRLFGFHATQYRQAPTHTPELVKHVSTTDMSPVKGDFPERVLFVCCGNMCRSAYAAVRFDQLAKQKKRSVRVASAGTLKLIGREAAPEMKETARENGLDLESHRSSALTLLMIQAADAIFVMTQELKRDVMRISPDSEPRIVLLGRYLPEPKDDIEDPMGREPEVYRAVAAEIDRALEGWFAKFEK